MKSLLIGQFILVVGGALFYRNCWVRHLTFPPNLYNTSCLICSFIIYIYTMFNPNGWLKQLKLTMTAGRPKFKSLTSM